MFVPIVLATVCLATSTVFAAYEKPYYDLEDAENLFKDFVKEHKKVYNRREYIERLEIFKESLKEINERNTMFPDTVFGVTQLADLKPHELKKYSGFKPPKEKIMKVKIPYDEAPVPEEFDWRHLNVVSPVKDQGQCGSCFIFGAIGNIEGQYAIKHSKCLALSEGQALDCLECGSCNGGEIGQVMGELSRTFLELEKDYPYHASKQLCLENKSKGVVEVSGNVTYLDTYSEDALKNHLVKIGPLAIAVNCEDFQHYKAGILEPHKCINQENDHAVLLVGYGREQDKDFWIIKNSWGRTHGEKGYVRLVRGKKACNIGSYTVTTTVF